MIYYDKYLEMWVYDDNVEQYVFDSKSEAIDFAKELGHEPSYIQFN